MKPILKISVAILLFSQLIGCIDTNQSGDHQAILNDTGVVQPYINPRYISQIEKHGLIVFPPGERSLYSNLRYGIIQKIIENISGESLSVYMKESVIDPLHLSNTFLFTFDSIHSENIAIEYLNDGSPAIFAESVECGAGRFYSSAHDLLIYGIHHLNKDFPNISSRHIEYMQSAFDSDIGTDGYGLGWEIYEAGSTRIIKHNGGGLGCDTRLTLIPSENMVVVVLKNSRRGSSTYIASNIVEAFDDQLLTHLPNP